MVQLLHLYMTTGKTMALTIRIFVGKVVSLLFNMLSRFVMSFLPRNKHLLTSWLKLLSASPRKEKKFIPKENLSLLPLSTLLGWDWLPWSLFFWCWVSSQLFCSPLSLSPGFPGGSAGKESACKVGDLGSIPGLGWSPGEANSYPLQYSSLEKSVDCVSMESLRVGRDWGDFHFTLIKRLFNFSSLSAIRVASSVCLRLLIFLSAILISVCDSFSPALGQLFLCSILGLHSLIFLHTAAREALKYKSVSISSVLRRLQWLLID